MILTEDTVKKLKTLLQTVSIVKIDKIIIEDGLIRGVDDNITVLIISDTDVPDFGGARIGLKDIPTLLNRISLLDTGEKFVLEAVEAPNKDKSDPVDISSFKISTKSSKFEFRLGRAALIKAPKRIEDNMVWAITIDPASVKIATSAANTLASDQIAIVSKQSGEVLFEIVDSATQDTFTTKIADEAMWIPEDQERPTQSFVHYYAIDKLMPLLKAATAQGDPYLTIGEGGMLQIAINKHTFTLLPREDE